MIYRGTVRNGEVVLEDGVMLPDGTRVIVTLVSAEKEEKTAQPPTTPVQPKTLYERLKNVIGAVDDMPPDAAENHDH